MQKGSVKLNLRREQKMIGQIIARVNSVEDEIRDAKQYPMRIE
jgi:hypothetical protein